MLTNLDTFYWEQPEPNQGFMLALRHYILQYDSDITEKWKYKLPFFYYKESPFCYIWKDAKTQQPYLGIVKAQKIEDSLLVQGNRKKMKILPMDAYKEIPIADIDRIFNKLMPLY